MADLARLQFDFDSAPALRGSQDLDKLTAASARTQKQMEQLARSTTALAAAAQTQSTATQISNQRMLAALQAEQQLESLRLKAQITQEGRNQSLARLAQLGRDALSVTKLIAAAEVQGAMAQDRYNASLQTFAQVAARGIELQKQMAAANQNSINSRLGVSDSFAGPDRTADTEAYGASLDALRAKYSPLFAASKEYEAALDGVNQAERVGAISEHEATVARENARLAFEKGTVAANAASKGFSGAGGSLANLSFQINDIATGLASGQSPFQILAQQGGQIFQIWQMNPGIFKESATALRGLLTPATLVGGAMVGLGLAVAAAFNSYIESEKRLQAATQGLGAATGATVGELQSIANQAVASGKVTIGQAEEMEAAYAKTGMIGKQNLLGLVGVTKDFAAQTGLSVDDATARLARMASDPMKGIDDLALSIGGVTGQTRELIQAQLAQGNQQRAVTIFTEAARKSLVDYRTNQTALGREGSLLWTAAVNGWHDTGKSISDSYDNLVKFNLKYGEYLRMLPGGQIISALAMPPPPPPAESKGRADINQAYRQLGSVDQETGYDQLFALQREAGKNQAALPIMKANRLSTTNPDGFTASEIDRTTIALARQRGAISSMVDANGKLITSEDVRLRQDQLTIQGLTQRTPAEQAAIARQQTYLSLVGAHVDATKAMALADSAGAVAFATAQKALDDQNKTIKTSIAGSIAVANAFMQGGVAAAMTAQARTQAEQEKISNPAINVEIRSRQILAQTIGSQTTSLESQMDQQLRLNQVTAQANGLVASGGLAYDKANDFIQDRVGMLQLQDLRQAAVNSQDQKMVDLLDQMIARYPALTKLQRENATDAQINGMLNPNVTDITGILEMRRRQAAGLVSKDDATAAIASTGLRQSSNGLLNDMGQANPFGEGSRLGAQGAMNGVEDERAQRLKLANDSIRDAQQLEDAKTAIEQDAARKRLAIATEFEDARLALGQNTFDRLATGLSDMFGKSSQAYKAAFAVEKAFQIARTTLAIETAIAQAAAIPWPANIPAIAQAVAMGGQLLSQVSAVAGQGFATGVVGIGARIGGSSSDTIPAWLTPGESVVTAPATSKNRNTLAAMNAGAGFDGVGRPADTNIRVEVIHDGSTSVRYERVSDDHIRVLARQEADQSVKMNAPNAVAASQRNPNGVVAKAMAATMHGGRKRI